MRATASRVRLKELHSRNRAGKAVLKLTAGALVLPPAAIALAAGAAAAEGAALPPAADARVALVNSEGRLLLLAAGEVPELPRGKGNKLFGIPTKKAESREETLVGDDGAVGHAVAARELGRAADDAHSRPI